MNACLRIAVLSLSVLGLAACAGTQSKSAYVEPAAVGAPQSAPLTRDEIYVAQVERIARRRGIGLVWVNPPPKRGAAVAQATH
ncbi:MULTISPECIES: hypothetical protein [Lysobacter]|uniref:Lipoprotein n=2 Tax=Lysobacter TaxID=68 RepID=A0A0S2DEC6_LYSEN|nr:MULTISPECIES: hypothetical protein [Lysobacter]ALN56850.1 lipoprotein [Lysobacter enzymogenes]QCW25589.1 hypothetical protein FE772_07835 [Lysobacter enzymogenes]QQP99896.1 hypothetical protein JHW41_17520 [Lysobacter enzymogenes]UZW59342.1 hypothetical protein BV903_018845 [Lysobacter enzymogenes]WMT03120.1 hypothetical protein RDV84_24725 [Lysobacter yananisis]